MVTKTSTSMSYLLTLVNNFLRTNFVTFCPYISINVHTFFVSLLEQSGSYFQMGFPTWHSKFHLHAKNHEAVNNIFFQITARKFTWSGNCETPFYNWEQSLPISLNLYTLTWSKLPIILIPSTFSTKLLFRTSNTLNGPTNLGPNLDTLFCRFELKQCFPNKTK